MEGELDPVIETYIPLYRKYRPQQFSDLVGQEVVSTAIGNALALNKIAHAYLFCGPRGTGKTSSARIFAKSLNCEQGPTITPCQVCASCTSITHGNALDVTEIDAASNNGVDHIRDLTDKVQFSPIQGKFKVYIIDEVHMLSTAAFNALLKTLEEPPPNVVFIFATTEPHKVLPTIISRCQRFDFSRITRNQIESRLTQVAQLESIQIAPEAIMLIARHVRGGLRDALGLLDQVAVLGRSGVGKEIQPEDVRAFIGVLEEELLLETAQGIQGKEPGKILQQIQVLQERGVEPSQMCKELTQHFRNLLIAKTCGFQVSGDQFDIAPDFYQKLCQQAAGFEAEEIPQMMSRLSVMENQLKHSQQPQLWLEVGLLDLCYRQDIHLVQELAERVTQLEQMLQNGTPTMSTRSQNASQPALTRSQPQQRAYNPPPEALSQPQRPVPQEQVPPALSPAQVPDSTLSAAGNSPVDLPSSVSDPVEVVGSAERQNLDVVWQRVMGAIASPPAKALISVHFSLVEIFEDEVVIGYGSEMIFEKNLRNDLRKMESLEQAVKSVVGNTAKLKFKLHKVVAAPKMAPPINRPAEAEPTQAFAEDEPPPELELPPVSMASLEALASQTSPRYEELPSEKPMPLAAAFSEIPTDEEEYDADMQQSKKFAGDLLQAKLLD